MNRRQMLKVMGNVGVTSVIAPRLKSAPGALGTVLGSFPGLVSETPDPANRAPIYSLGAANLGVWTDWYLCPWFADKDRTHFDAADWIRRLKNAGIDYMIVESRFISGLWLFPPLNPMGTFGVSYERDSNPDEIWPRSGRIEPVSRDYLAELAAEAKRQDLRIMISVWVTDSAFGITHPDWMKCDQQGKLLDETGSAAPSFASPYADYIAGEIKGILDRSPNIEAVVFDGLMEGICDAPVSYDRYTKQLFEKKFGKPMAAGSDEEIWQVVDDIYVSFLEKIRGVLSGRPIDIQLLSTASGYTRVIPPGPRRDADIDIANHVDDIYEEGHELVRTSCQSKMLRSTGKPYELTSPADLFWTEYLFRPWARVAADMALALSQGGNFATSIRPFQSGLLTNGETDNLAKAGQWVKRRKPFFVNAEPVLDAAIWLGPMLPLHHGVQPLIPAPGLWPGLEKFLSISMVPGDNGGMLYDHHDFWKPANGLDNALREHHIPFAVLSAEAKFDEYQLVVLQDGVCMDDKTAEGLRRFVDRGGALFAEGHASLLDEHGNKRPDFALSDVLGINFDGYSPHVDANYLTITNTSASSDLPDHPLIVEGGAIHVKTTTANSLGWLVYPAANRLEYRTLGAHNCPGERTDHPAVTRNCFGKGEAVYVIVGIGRHIMLRGNSEPWTKQLTANLMNSLVRQPLYSTDAPPSVEVVVNRQGDRYIAHFLNYNIGMDYTPATTRVIPPSRFGFDLSSLRVPNIDGAFLAPNGESVSFQRKGDWWSFQFEQPDPIDTILVIQSKG